ncbi:MAG: hypothetical protein E6K84_04120 [Thaumarchaeota archaeon]|nr:MAG: hypothetical protein E6K84_04120 [Nitrososphaerota archaeon]
MSAAYYLEVWKSFFHALRLEERFAEGRARPSRGEEEDILPIGDLYKTEVRRLGETLGLSRRIISKRSSPRLWPRMRQRLNLASPTTCSTRSSNCTSTEGSG